MQNAAAVQASGPELTVAAATLADGFRHDPVINWIFDSLADPTGAMGRFWAMHVDPLPDDLVVLADPAGRSAAIWQEPREADQERVDDRDFVGTITAEIGEEIAMVKLGALAVVEHAHPRDRPHWYLAAVATRQEHQGSGCGPTVVEPVLERCDSEGLPAYLESSNPRNVGFYERLGFVVTGEILVDGGPSLIPMWRDPR